MSTEHTKTPWHLAFYASTPESTSHYAVKYGDKTIVSTPTKTGDSAEDEANVAFICRAANAHEAVVAALKNVTRIVEAFSYTTTLSKSHLDRLAAAKAAIALAGGKETA